MWSGRLQINKIERYKFEDLTIYALLISYGDPSTFQEDIASHDKDKCMGVMMEEIESLRENETWEHV